uniref:BED-type domain-containing protein n=1 Tax=Fagus sylvatica TaxID=28930 RepID=A0A2N9IRW0_FAGSY
MTTRSKHGIFKPKVFHTSTNDYSETEPPTYQLASKYPKWCTAMDEEYSALHRQQTWLVAKGFHQQHGIDFQETFSPVVKPPTVRLILALAVTYNWPLQQLDVRNAFLHGVLQEEVYMSQPPGYVASHLPQHVCRLHKSIYGLKQAPRAWFESFTTQLLTLGFHPSTADTSLFIYRDRSIIAFLLLYVDDIVLTGNTPSFLQQLIANLSTVFELKDMGTLSYFLGLQIQRSTKGLTVTQTKYATDLLTKHNMVHCSPCKTPCVPNVCLSSTCGQPLTDIHAYRSLVGALHYLTFTRPDISFAVHQAPSLYLPSLMQTGLVIQMIRRSTSGMLVFLGPNPITWSAKKQLTVSRSSTEAEYRALASALAKLCWLRTLVKDLGIFLSDPPILWCDNVSALAIASNPVFHARTKHIEVDFHFIRERVIRKDLQVKFVSTMDQLADIFTKGLSSPRFQDLQSKLLVPVDTIRLRGDDEVSVNCRCKVVKNASVWMLVGAICVSENPDITSMNEEVDEFGESASSVSKKTRCRTSTIWSEFELEPIGVDGQQKAKCKRCNRTYAAGDNRTTSLLRHARKCSKKVNDGDETVDHHRPIDQDMYREMLALAIIRHNYPFSYAEHENNRLIHVYLNPEVKPVSRNTAKQDVIKIYKREKESLKFALKSISGRFCLTSDLWSSSTTDHYMVVTAHFVDENWVLQKKVLSFSLVPPPRGGAILADRLLAVLQEWGIDRKIFSITLDNASYNETLVNSLKENLSFGPYLPCSGEFFHVRCGAHVLNLIVQDGLKVIDEVVHNIRESVKYVKGSDSRRLKFAGCLAMLPFLTKMATMLRDKLYSAFEEYVQSTPSNIGNVVETTSSSGGMGSGRYDKRDDLSGFDTFESELVGSMSSKSQLSLYLEESRHDHRIHVDLDVLGFWKSQYSRFPELSLMARDILSIPITSVASEFASRLDAKASDAAKAEKKKS